jgi:hypothetical protein
MRGTPKWDTGEEAVVASPVALAVATVPDWDNGPRSVEVEVWLENPADGDE